jgi:hypothetical protein
MALAIAAFLLSLLEFAQRLLNGAKGVRMQLE